jgi:pimeloyl-ACP methyl ester carboxylesterase
MSAVSQLQTGSARRVQIDAGGLRIGALRIGAPDGPPVLLVPGYTGSKEDFGPILDALGAAGFCATAVDLPGQLDSDALPELADYRPDRLAGIVREIGRRLGERPLLLGHSFGGLVARAAVIAEPALFDSLVLLSSGPAQLGGVRRETMDRLDPVLATGGLPAVWAALQAALLDDPHYVAPPRDVAEFVERRFFAGSPVMLQGMADALRAEPDRVAALAATGVPVLVAHGAADDAWPPAVQREMAQRLGARYVVIADAAHAPAVENPAATVAALVEFWGG